MGACDIRITPLTFLLLIRLVSAPPLLKAAPPPARWEDDDPWAPPSQGGDESAPRPAALAEPPPAVESAPPPRRRWRFAGPQEPDFPYELTAGVLGTYRRFAFDGDPAMPATACYAASQVVPANMILKLPARDLYTALPSCPSQAVASAGLHLRLLYYPLLGHGSAWLSGLALAGNIDIIFPTASSQTEVHGGGELRYELHGLLKAYDYIAVLLALQIHSAPLSDAPNQPAATGMSGYSGSIPTARYSYLGIGLEAGTPYLTRRHLRVGLDVQARYHLVFGLGELGDAANPQGQAPSRGMGPAAAVYGGRVQVTPLEVTWRYRYSYSLGLQLYYELYRVQSLLASAQGGLPPTGGRDASAAAGILTSGSRDDFFGGMLYLRVKLNGSAPTPLGD